MTDIEKLTYGVIQYQGLIDLIGWLDLSESDKDMLIRQTNAAIEGTVRRFDDEYGVKIDIQGCYFTGLNPDGSPVLTYTDGRVTSFKMHNFYCEGPTNEQ